MSVPCHPLQSLLVSHQLTAHSPAPAVHYLTAPLDRLHSTCKSHTTVHSEIKTVLLHLYLGYTSLSFCSSSLAVKKLTTSLDGQAKTFVSPGTQPHGWESSMGRHERVLIASELFSSELGQYFAALISNRVSVYGVRSKMGIFCPKIRTGLRAAYSIPKFQGPVRTSR